MRAQAGWGAAVLVAVAALVGVSSQQSDKPASDTGVPRSALGGGTTVKNGSHHLEDGPCAELEDKLRAFFVLLPNETVAPDSCYPEGGSSASRVLPHDALGLQFVIAIVPDPLHTHLSLSFDRLMEAIQQGAQDEGYFYDSSWLPWDTEEQPFALLADVNSVERRKKDREDQPGVLLFRKATPSLRPYDDGLVVFVAGEEPTSGVHKRQFENAVHWITKLHEFRPVPGVQPANPMKILGPTFSGSLPSLAHLLSGRLSAEIPRPIPIYSGGITSAKTVKWFVAQSTAGYMTFRSFQQSDEVMICRYRDYLKDMGVVSSRLAIISEDETAFGESMDEKGDSSRCGTDDQTNPDSGPPRFYYPRDISALRGAYQKQSIFSAGSTVPTAGTPHRTLSTDIADPEGKEHDTIRSYSGNQAALSQEAVLQQIVSLLRAHESQYVLLRSSNPMDQLFLSHFLRIAYPEGRIVIQGADLLMRRESGAATLSGIMTLTTYPLLPSENEWTPIIEDKLHSHRVFAEDIAEGTYVASRFLLELDPNKDCTSRSDPRGAADANYFLPVNCAPLPIHDYTPPFWMGSLGAVQRPATWLSVLGRDGFWPVASLASRAATSVKERPSFPIGSSVLSLWQLLVRTVVFASGLDAPPDHHWSAPPISMKVCLIVVFVWGLFHLYCCMRPSLTLKPGYRAHFVRIPGESHLALIVFGSVMVSFVPVLLGWGYGAMSAMGEPVANAWYYRAFLPLTWLIGAWAVCANAWVESDDYPRLTSPAKTVLTSVVKLRSRETTSTFQTIVKVSWRPLLWYFGSTTFLFLLTAFFLEASLQPANRIPTYLRAISLTSGVSPLVPLLGLAAGLYCWFWYSLQGLGLFGDDRPLLPTQGDLLNAEATPNNPDFLSMFSKNDVADPIEALSDPLAPELCLLAPFLVIALSVISFVIAGGVPLRTLGSGPSSILFCIGLVICVTLMLINAWQLLRVWLRLRQLLVFLDRTPLRRTMETLKGYSWGRVWKMGGNVLDARYRLLSRQLESLTHLSNSWLGAERGQGLGDRIAQLVDCFKNPRDGGEPEWHKQVDATLQPRATFVKWYSTYWNDWRVRDLKKLHDFQKVIAKAVGHLLASTLIDEWKREKESLIPGPPVQSDERTDGRNKGIAEAVMPSRTAYVQSAEELVCLTYLGFIQNILGRMRTLVMAILWLFVAVTISLASYPFDPRPLASGAMLILFLVLGTVVVVVYAQMHRDTTLSNVTDTAPGELGTEFWLKLIGFGVGPLLGLVATAYPELTGGLFSWLQPALTSTK